MNSVVAILFCGIISFVLFLLFYRAFRFCVSKKEIKAIFTRRNTIIFLAIVLIGFLLVVFSMSKNNFIYYWDYGGYWTASYTHMNSMFLNPFEAVANLYKSIVESDYNLILPTVICLPLKIFGYTFSRYVYINYFIFMVPTWVIMLFLFKKIGEKIGIAKNKVFGIAILNIATFTFLFIAMLLGYIDIACLIPSSLLALLLLDYNPTEFSKKQVKRDVLISLLLLATFLFRRYFAYYVIGYVVAILVFSLYRLYSLRKQKNIKKIIKNELLNIIVIGGVASLILIVFFNGLIFHILSSNYSQQYEGYNLPYAEKMGQLVSRFGIVVLALSIFGTIFSFLNRENRRIVALSVVSILTTVFLFFRVQRMDVHHTYTIVIQIMILSYVGLLSLRKIKVKGQPIVEYVAIGLLAIQPINCFSENFNAYIGSASIIFSEHNSPLRRNDIPKLKELEEYLNSINKEYDKKIYVAASSGILNSSILEALEKPYSNHAINGLQNTSDVDLRDGFPSAFLTSDIIVTTSPVQLHLAKGTQEVVEYLNDGVKDEKSIIGKHFTKMDKEYILDNDVKVQIYYKISDFEDSDLQSISKHFSDKYPGQDKLFSDRILTN